MQRVQRIRSLARDRDEAYMSQSLSVAGVGLISGTTV
jgi:hypothetical protein